MKKRHLILSTLLILSATTGADAMSCIGVEARVNIRTSQLTTAVLSKFTTLTTTYTAQQISERARILSALRVFGAQGNLSNQQQIDALSESAKALSSAIVEESVTSQMRDAVARYSDTGYNACGILEAAKSVYEVYGESQSEIVSTHNSVMAKQTPADDQSYQESIKNWSALAQSTDATLNDVINGDVEKTKEFTELLIGAPERLSTGDGVTTAFTEIKRASNIARKSVIAYTMAELASSRDVEVKLAELNAEWLGDDGGQQWAAKLAASPTRATLLDMARIEAANIAGIAVQIKKQQAEELALATYALAVVDEMTSEEASR